MRDQSSIIQDICLKLLTRREHSRKELLEKLVYRGFDKLEVQQVIEKLTEQGWQSDRRYAESYARQRIGKGYGPIRIAYELQQRGGENLDLDVLISDLGSTWFQQLKQTYQQKYGEHRRMTYADWAKCSRFLLQRGFNAAMIKELSDQLEIH